jgi:hypothetical protein
MKAPPLTWIVGKLPPARGGVICGMKEWKTVYQKKQSNPRKK